MRHVHVDVADLLIVLLDDQHLFGRLDEEDRPVALIDVEIGHTAGPAALARRERHLPGKDRLVHLAHAFDGARFQDGIAQIRDAIGRLTHIVGHVGMAFFGDHGPRTAVGRQEIIPGYAIWHPRRRAVGRESGRGLLRRRDIEHSA